MTRITTHVLDTSLGRPAAGLKVRLDRMDGGKSEEITSARTDAEGRVRDWSQDSADPSRTAQEGIGGSADHITTPGHYRLVFETGQWFHRTGRDTLYPEVVIHVNLADAEPHYHIALLLAPFGYSTYRGT